MTLPPKRLHLGTWSVGWKLQHRGCVVQVALPILQLLMLLFSIKKFPLPQGVVGILHC